LDVEKLDMEVIAVDWNRVAAYRGGST